MKRKGICQKCGEEKIVQDHHIKGYATDEVAPYCQSCDLKAHVEAKKNGRCLLSSDKTRRLSRNSYKRRSTKSKMLSSKTVDTNIQLFEELYFNINTEKITISSYFQGNHGKKLKIITEI